MTIQSRVRSALSLNGLLADRMGWAPASLGSLAVTVGLVGLAAGLRLIVGHWVAGVHFITFFPAIVLATLLCGPVAGIVAAALSAILSVWVIGPGLASGEEVVILSLFIGVAALDVAVVSSLLSVVKALKGALADVAQLNDNLRQGEIHFRDLMESTPEAMMIVDREDRIVLANAQAADLFGYEAGAMQGRPVEMLMPVRFRAKHPGHVRQFGADPRPRPMGAGLDLRGLHAHGNEFPIDVKLSSMHPATGGMIIAVIRDITQQRLAEARQELLVHELNHRVKNTLAVVQSIVRLSSRFSTSQAEFDESFAGRLVALAQSHDVLTRNDWSGAVVGDILREQLTPFDGGGGLRIHLEGPTVAVNAQTAISLGLAIGELVTNAAKHGALSTETGSIHVTWRTEVVEETARLHITWQESGGPPVRPPGRRGFGTVMIERSLTHGLGGSAQLFFDPNGLRCEIELPVSRTAAGVKDGPAAASPSRQ